MDTLHNLSCPHLDFLDGMQLSSLDEASPDCDPKLEVLTHKCFIQLNGNLCRASGLRLGLMKLILTRPSIWFAVPSFYSMCDSMLHGKRNSTHRLSKANISDITGHPLTSPFAMEELMKGIIILKNNEAAGLYYRYMICEQIKYLGPKALVWLKEMMNNIMLSKKLLKLWRQSKVIAILKYSKYSSLHKSWIPISLLCNTCKLFIRWILNRLNPITEPTIIREQAGFRAGRSCTCQLLNLTEYIEDDTRRVLLLAPYSWTCLLSMRL